MFSADDKISLMEAAPDITVDTEGFPTMVGFSVAFSGLQQGLYLPFNHVKDNLTPVQQSKVYEILDSRESLIFHNALHDLRVLKRSGLNYRGWFWCTMLMAHWINEERYAYDLTAISTAYGGKPKAMPPQMSAIIDSDGWNVVPVAWMDEYSSNDALITHQLWRKELVQFKQEFSLDLWAIEQDFIRDVMGPMMDLGIKVDLEFSIHEYMRGQGIMNDCLKELGFKPSSPKAMEQFLIKDLALPVVKHTKSCKKCYPEDRRMRGQSVSLHDARPSFDKDAMEIYDAMLEKVDDHRAKTILTYKGWMKTNSSNYKSYINLVDDECILHPSYNLHRTVTSRLSCSDPNLQQIPKESDNDWNGNLKSAFIARDGFGLWTVDYSQLQFRMSVAYAVAWARDRGYEPLVQILLDIFNDSERDIFTEMASLMAWERADVKTLVYLIIFGGGGKRASVAFGVSIEAGQELVNEFYALYPEIKKVAKECERAAMRQGYVTYWTGRRRHFPKGSAYYRAFNAVIQGGEAEIIKRAMIRIQREICDKDCRMLLQIHDEIAFEITVGMEGNYLPRIQVIMEEVGKEFGKFLDVDIQFKTSAKKWGDK